MALKNYSTGISHTKTIMEIEQLLTKFGAKAIMKEYLGENVSVLSFYIEIKDKKIPFKLPLKIEKARAVVERLVENKKLGRKYLEEPMRTNQALRIGWRVVKDWIHSNLSLIEIEFADPVEIFLPYAYDFMEEKTVYDKFIENKSKFLALGENDTKNK